MHTIHYKTSNCRLFGHHSKVGSVSQDELGSLQQSLQERNSPTITIKLIVSDDKQKVIMATEKLSKEDKEVLGQMNYKIKRGL